MSIGGAKWNRTRVRFPNRIAIEAVFVLIFGRLSFCPRERYRLKSCRMLLDYQLAVQSLLYPNHPMNPHHKRAEIVGTGLLASRPIEFRNSQSNRRPQIQATSITGNRSSPDELRAPHNSFDFSWLFIIFTAWSMWSYWAGPEMHPHKMKNVSPAIGNNQADVRVAPAPFFSALL